jgi:magnesium-protoporphyrin O-methyltransferase
MTEQIVQPQNDELEPRKARLRDYFSQTGFERWNLIYGDAPVSFIRRTVREGHTAVMRQTLAWLAETANGKTLRVLDAGCGPGVVSLEVARRGHTVTGCDISPQMAEAARERLAAEPEIAARAEFVAADLEGMRERYPAGAFEVAICLDVLIYYPEAELARIVGQLGTLAPGRLLFTYAPASLPLRAMHWLGKRFPRRHRATKLEIIGEKAVRRALAVNGLKLARQRHFNKGFYHVVLAEAVPV